jgi:serine/threonine protein kinase
MQPPSPPPAAPPLTVEDFCRLVLRSGLLNEPELRAAIQTLPAGQAFDAPALAEHLVRRGKLSRFQSRKLLAGRTRGLMLGAYQILSLIGKGGSGAVFLARDSRNGLLVALKVLQVSQAEERVRARFRREMELGRLVDHPHLALTLDAGHLQGVDYIVMEYIPGKSLYRMTATEGPLPVDRAARLFAEVADALEHAHGRGLVHRDLKPSNIMITPHGHAKVLDLGLALVRGEVAERSVVGGQGYILGTMDYISPEQTLDAAKVDARSDLYSLGCSLYFALSGQVPFPGGANRDKILRHRSAEPTPLAELRPDLPPAFVALVRRLMDKDPAQRFPSAAAAAEALRAWAVGEVQPLDRPDDATYVAEVAALQATDVALDESQIDLPAVEGMADRLAEGDSFTLPRRAARPPSNRAALWLLFGLGVLLAAGVVMALAIAFGGGR